MTKIISLITLVGISVLANAQVGINTATPEKETYREWYYEDIRNCFQAAYGKAEDR